MSYESQNLLGNPSSWSPKVAVTLGVCAATALFAASSTTSLFVIPVVAKSTPIAAQPLPIVSSKVPLNSASAAAPRAAVGQVEVQATQASQWRSLAVIAAAPFALFGLISALRSKTVRALDPMDLSSGTQWNMMATSGEFAVAKNYANALIELGQEGQCLEQLHSDMDNFGSIVSDETFAGFFNNPLILGDKQKDIIAKICEENNMSPITKNFVSFLVDKKRLPQLSLIIREFDEQFYEATGTQVATVTAAVPLSEDQLRLIANKLHELTKGKNIKIKSQVNSDLIAGFVLEYGKSGSQRIDLSLRGQLDELQGELKEGVRKILSAGVPVGAQLLVAALGVNAVLAGHASAATGNVFDFGLTMPLQMVQFLLLMVFLDKTVFGPVGKIIDDRANYVRQKSSSVSDNSKELAALNAQAESLLEAARRDAAKELEKAKKEAAALGAEKMAKAKAEMDASVKRGMAELENSKKELWAKLEAEVLPVLADDIVNKLLQEEPSPAAAAKQ